MAKKNGHDKAIVSGRARVPAVWVIAALLAVQTLALGLKAWDERQTADISSLAILQRTAVATSERLSGQANLLASNLSASRPSALDPSRFDGVDLLMPLSTASNAQPGSRERMAADAVLRGEADGHSFTITPFGDVALSATIASGTRWIAIGPASEWLPYAGTDYAFAFVGEATLTGGNPRLADVQLSNQQLRAPAIISSQAHPRAGVACTPIANASLSICALMPSPVFGERDAIRLLIYALLWLAPALAIIGLYRILRSQTAKVSSALDTERRANHVFDLVMQGAQAGFWSSYLNSCTADISEQFAALVGAERAGEIHADAFMELVLEDDRATVRTAFDRAKEIGVVNVAFRTKASGGATWLEIVGRQIEDVSDKGFHCAGIVTDITARRQADDRLRTAERRLRNALEGYDGPFAIWDARKRLLYWNGAYARAFRLQTALRPGMSHDTVVLARNPSVRGETPSETEPNTSLVQLVSGRWIKMVDRTTPEGGLISVGIDVTDREESNLTLTRQSQKLKRLIADLERSEGQAAELSRKYAEEKEKAERAAHSKSAFLANMSHELRTPLNAINGFSEILTTELYGPLGDGRYKEYANDILRSGQHLLDMINDILDMAKIEAGKMTINRHLIDPVDPVDAALRMIGRKAADANIKLVFDAEDDLPLISADHRAIRQMMLNLVSNAIKFTNAGGRIAVTIRKRAPYIRFAVTDTGIGIPEKDLPRLAQPFEQVNGNSDRNYEGTGLGLALTKSFAEMHGGKLSIASQNGKGTTVAFYLPIDDKPVKPAPTLDPGIELSPAE